MEIRSYQKSKDNFIKVNAYNEGVDTIPEKLTRIINLPNGSMIRVKRNKVLYYNPKQKAKRNKKIIAALVSLSLAASLIGVFNPIITQSYQKIKSEIELGKRPPQMEITQDLIPDNINNNEIIDDIEKNEFLDLSESALLSINNLTNKINDIFLKYSDIEGTLTPAFVLINFDNQIPKSFKLFCDLDNERFVCFEYNISNVENFENLTETSDIEITSIINGLNNSLINRDLLDIPTVGRKIKINNIEYYASPITEKTEAKELNESEQTYDIQEYYTFTVDYANGTNLYEQKIKILKSDAEKLENFNSNNIDCLYDIYLKDNTKFEKEDELNLGKDPMTTILLSAKNSNANQENNLEQ